MAVLNWLIDFRGLWRRPAWLFAVAAWLAQGATVWSAEATVSSEYQLKAVFLFNFTQFVEWPREAFADANAPIVIGVLGTDPFGAYLDQTVQGETINGRPLQIRRYRSVAEIGTCHVLFISQSEALRVKDIVSRLRSRSILTVGDFESFATNGGIIRFWTDKSRIRLRVNLESARAAGLTISSKLLRSAEIVASQKE